MSSKQPIKFGGDVYTWHPKTQTWSTRDNKAAPSSVVTLLNQISAAHDAALVQEAGQTDSVTTSDPELIKFSAKDLNKPKEPEAVFSKPIPEPIIEKPKVKSKSEQALEKILDKMEKQEGKQLTLADKLENIGTRISDAIIRPKPLEYRTELNKLSDLTAQERKRLRQMGVAPASERDFSFRYEGTPLTKDQIRDILNQDTKDRNDHIDNHAHLRRASDLPGIFHQNLKDELGARAPALHYIPGVNKWLAKKTDNQAVRNPAATLQSIDRNIAEMLAIFKREKTPLKDMVKREDGENKEANKPKAKSKKGDAEKVDPEKKPDAAKPEPSGNPTPKKKAPDGLVKGIVKDVFEYFAPEAIKKFRWGKAAASTAEGAESVSEKPSFVKSALSAGKKMFSKPAVAADAVKSGAGAAAEGAEGAEAVAAGGGVLEAAGGLGAGLLALLASPEVLTVGALAAGGLGAHALMKSMELPKEDYTPKSAIYPDRIPAKPTNIRQPVPHPNAANPIRPKFDAPKNYDHTKYDWKQSVKHDPQHTETKYDWKPKVKTDPYKIEHKETILPTKPAIQPHVDKMVRSDRIKEKARDNKHHRKAGSAGHTIINNQTSGTNQSTTSSQGGMIQTAGDRRSLDLNYFGN